MAFRLRTDIAIPKDVFSANIEDLIKINPKYILYLENPSLELQEYVVSISELNIRFIKNPDREVVLQALERDGNLIHYVEEPDAEMIETAVRSRGSAVQWLPSLSDELYALALETCPAAFRFIKNPSYEIQLLAVTKDAKNIAFIDNPDLALVQIAADTCPEILNDLGHLSDQELFGLIKKTPEVILGVPEKNDAFYITAALNNWKVIKFIGAELRERISSELIQRDGRFLVFYGCSDRSVVRQAVETYPQLCFVDKTLSLDIYMTACRLDSALLETIQDAMFRDVVRLSNEWFGSWETLHSILGLEDDMGLVQALSSYFQFSDLAQPI